MLIKRAWRQSVSARRELRDAYGDILYMRQSPEEFWGAFDFMSIDWYENEDDLIGDEVVVRT